MNGEDRKRLDHFEELLTQLWHAIIGTDGQGFIKRWEHFEREILPRLMTRDECERRRQSDDDLIDRRTAEAKARRERRRAIYLAVLATVGTLGSLFGVLVGAGLIALGGG